MTGADPVAVLRALCTGAARRAQGTALRAELDAIGHQLGAPLQLAVAGAVSAGKSTLINAVLRRAVAPVDAGECTRLVTWYEFGEDGRALVECTDGSVHPLRLDDGRVPDDLGVAPERVARLRVQLDEAWLREVTVIDTPGMNTVTAEGEQATRRLLFGDAAAEHAQALLYVLRHVQRFDADTLEEFRTVSAACGLTAVTTAAVLTQVDRRGDEDDPWPTARRLAARATADLAGVALDVVPVVGLLAETGRGRLLGSDAVAELRALARLPPDELDDLLLDLDEFVEDGGPARRTLAARLHRYGIREATHLLRRHPELSADELHTRLAGLSGYGAEIAAGSPTVTVTAAESARTLADVLDRFARHAGRLKALAAIRRLGALTGGPADRLLLVELRDAVDENRPIAEGLGSLRILAAVAAHGRGQLPLDAAMTAELMTLARHDAPAAALGLSPLAGPPEIAAAAQEASRRWRRVAQLAGPSVGGHRARDVLGVLEDIAAAHARRAPRAAPPVPPPVLPAPAEPPPGGPAPSEPGGALDRAALQGLLDLPVLGERERAAVAALLAAADVRGIVGVAPGTSRAVLVAEAAELAGRFRALLHRPLPAPQRRAVRAACDLFESMVHGLRAHGRSSDE